ncbi:MAG: hypothetical protein N2067_00485 [Spirochaetaceae bacterium]|nr:hypothetical protein [Spirochaetaceae bacterium]
MILLMGAIVPSELIALEPPPANPPALRSVSFQHAGTVAQQQVLVPGVPFGSEVPPIIIDLFASIRDATYNNLDPGDIESRVRELEKLITITGIATREALLMQSRAWFLAGRAWKDQGDNREIKHKAVECLETSLGYAEALLSFDGETPHALVAKAEALSELCLLKDLTFLLRYGPLVGNLASKALAQDPCHLRAAILKANALAYPPPLWGGNYRNALAQFAQILQWYGNGMPPDSLFDVRIGIATAYHNLKMPEHAAWWFTRALDLYPSNMYAVRKDYRIP